MALSNEALKKKHLTAEEHAMRRAEMARRRKNLSEKKNEEEKVSTHLMLTAWLLLRTPVSRPNLSAHNIEDLLTAISYLCLTGRNNQQTPFQTFRPQTPHPR